MSDFPAARRMSAEAHAAFQTLPEIVADTLKRLLCNPGRPIHPSRIGEVDRIVAEHSKEVIGAVRQDKREHLQTVLNRLWTKITYGGFYAPKPEPIEFDRIQPNLSYFEWPSIEQDLLRMFIHSPFAAAGTPAKKVGRINFWGVELDGQWLSREDLRKNSRPAVWKSGEHAWLATFQPIPTRQELESRAQRSPDAAAKLRAALRVAEEVRAAKS